METNYINEVKVKAHKEYSKYGKVNAIGLAGDKQLVVRFEDFQEGYDERNIPRHFAGYEVDVRKVGPIKKL